ncbi:hypothetical protein HHX47_DHR5000099 [Lentinula edodes]|nr:hypothetical protein HHX47_DHR5000099 [Lentinula edodes]
MKIGEDEVADYKRLPEETRDYIFDAAKSIRQNEFDSKEQMEQNMAHLDGIVVHKIPLMPLRSSGSFGSACNGGS